MLRDICALFRNKRYKQRHSKDNKKKDPNIKKDMDRKCRMCGIEEENIFHVIASCSHLSSNLYLNARHNPAAQALYNDIVADVAKAEITNSYKKPDSLTRTGPLEI